MKVLEFNTTQIDRDLYRAIDDNGGIRLPSQYEVACHELDLTARGVAIALRAAVNSNSAYSETEKKMFKYEIAARTLAAYRIAA